MRRNPTAPQSRRTRSTPKRYVSLLPGAHVFDGYSQFVATQRQMQSLEHRQGTGATGRRAAGGGQGLGKDVALTSELHGQVTPVGRFGSLDPPPGLSPEELMEHVVVVVGAVDCGKPTVLAA